MNSENYKVLTNIIGAVESGGQVYGQRRYDAYAAPYTNTPNEHGPTLGWLQAYGNEGRRLVQMIRDRDPAAFARLDTANIAAKLSQSWENGWNPSAAQKKALIALITSPAGKEAQDELFAELMKKFIADCEATYTKEVSAVMMYCEIRHLGGKGPADRIFKRCKGDYSLSSIMAALKQDQNDTSSSNQVGDKKFQSRHEKCREFIERYAVAEDGGKEVMTPLQRAKTLLRQPQGSTMTGYTPDGKSYFVSAGAWYKTPQRGDVIYFYSSDKGRVGHVGIVERVDSASKIVYTIEGNTRSDAYAENGGCVARHSYSYKSMGGTNRVNGFGRPNFAAAGVTADAFVNTAAGELGYLEKRSNANLDSKTANAGSANYQKFQRDVGAGNADQWCQYFVDAIALYTCKGSSAPSSHIELPDTPTLNESVRWTGYVTTDGLNVRTWAGTENPLCSFSPLLYRQAVGVCDTVKAANGDTWYYILSGSKHGFASAKYISKTRPAENKTEEKKTEPAKKTTKKASDITVTQFCDALKKVMDKARTSGWHYGDSHATPPCSDKTISCDRLIARALYDLGFTDQRTGGETCGTLDAWLKAHGFVRSTKASAIKKGSILLVKHSGKTYISHAFVVVKYNASTWVTDRYDAGSDQRIRTAQPLKNEPWGYTREVIVYNIPAKEEKKEEKKEQKKETTGWKATGTATATVNGLNVRAGASSNSTILRTINKGNRFEIDGKKSGTWVHVNVAGTIGWISGQYIKYD